MFMYPYTDSPTSRLIARAFLDFIDSVELCPGVDDEGLEVAKDCLTEVFKLCQMPEIERPEPNLLLNIINSHEKGNKDEAHIHSEEAQPGPSAQNHGNKAVQSNKNSDAIEWYSCAIAHCENAVYYCNRAAAYTQIRKYNEAVKDCLKSFEIDPNYSKACSRLGLAY